MIELPNRITKEYINTLPIIRYDGQISVINRTEELSDILGRIPDGTTAGFDTETRPTFHRGQSHRVSLVQIAVPGKVLLVQLKQTGMHDSLTEFFERETVTKVGIALRDDILKLQELHPFEARGFIDLSDIAARKGIIQTGLRSLSARYLSGRITKTAQTSNWERRELTEKQKRYAATDAWACLEIYPLLLEDRRDYHEEENNVEDNGSDETAAEE